MDVELPCLADSPSLHAAACLNEDVVPGLESDLWIRSDVLLDVRLVNAPVVRGSIDSVRDLFTRLSVRDQRGAQKSRNAPTAIIDLTECEFVDRRFIIDLLCNDVVSRCNFLSGKQAAKV